MALETGILATTLALGGAGLAMAADPGSTQPPSSTTTDTQSPSSTTDTQEPSINGTLLAPPDETANGTDVELSEAEEAASLEGLATVSPEQATAAALTAVPGTAGETTLEDEDGFVVYEVQVTAADGSVFEVIVDAGDGRVLAQEVDEPEGTDEAAENGAEEQDDSRTAAQDETGENGAEDPNN